MRFNIIIYLTLIFCCLLSTNLSAQFENFITHNGNKLFDGDKEFRFISFNIPNLHYIEDYLPFNGVNPWRLPDEYEIRDALTSIKHLGGKVTRMYVLSVKKEEDDPDIVRHIYSPGSFDEQAFKTLDKVLQIANEVGVRVIIPFVDNWHWWGGPKEYAAFRGKGRDDFWSDQEIISDFKKTIEFVLNRVNTFTGVMYKDDKAIMAWEPGNELDPPFNWTKEIAAFIKSLDPNHLIIEGVISPDISQEALDDPNLDILSTHHYRNTTISIEKIMKNLKRINGRKPYIIGEYGIVPTQEIRAISDTIINQGLSGGMLWSLRFRNREGGFYHHYEYNNISAYRYPGFASGDLYDERGVLNLIRQKAFQIDGQTEPQIPIPEPPLLLRINNVGEISWQGSTGARIYTIERRENNTDEWIVISENIDDSKYPYRPLYSDESAEFGKEYFYRIKAKNESGESDYSNIVGPIEVTVKKFVDEMENFNLVFQKEGKFKFLTVEDIRKAKEEPHRLTGKNGSYFIYEIPNNSISLKIDFFAVKEKSDIYVSIADESAVFNNLELDTEVFRFGKNDYGFYDAVSYTTNNLPEKIKYVKITLGEDVQISRVEFDYTQ